MLFLRSIIIYIARFLESFFAFLFVYLILVLVLQSIKIGEIKPKGDITIYVRSNGVHTDVCFPSQSASYNWHDFVPTTDFPRNDSFDFITIGWGDKGFFLDTPTWAELKTSTALNAVFLPSATAMHVAYSSQPVESDKCIAVTISKEDYGNMIRYIQSSFKRNVASIELISGKGYSNNDNFYEATGSYHLFRTCNSWTNKVLRTGNVYTSLYAFFPDGIMEGLKAD